MLSLRCGVLKGRLVDERLLLLAGVKFKTERRHKGDWAIVVAFPNDVYAGYKQLINQQKKEIWELKKIISENEKNKNLLNGYKKVIEDLQTRLNNK